MTPPTIDQLRSSAPSSAHRASRLAWLVPSTVILGFSLLFLALFRDRLLPAEQVRISVALALPAAGDSVGPLEGDRAETSFQASGWVEPDPLPIRVASLVDGVVDQVHVQDGDAVREGQLLFSLVRADAEWAEARVRQEKIVLESGRTAHRAAIISARKRLALARAEAGAAAALRDEAADLSRRLDSLSVEAVAQSDVVAARLRLQRENAHQLAAELRAEESQAEVERMELEERAKDAEIAVAAVESERAALALARTSIVSPINGRVLSLHATPGQKKMLQSDGTESSTLAILYDPANLQVRVDVPLAEAARLRLGQSTRIHTAIFPGRELTGTVTRIAGSADLQRNTLQAKVRMLNPPDQVRPEMLCRVTFLANRQGPDALAASGASVSIWVPQSAVQEGSVWICDPDRMRVSRRAVGEPVAIRDGFARIAAAVRPGEWVVLAPSGLREGQRVRVVGSEP